MERKRISVIVALAVISTVSPLTYQYLIQPRVEAASVVIEFTSIKYNELESSNESIAFDIYLKLTNNENNDVILSPLQLDVYYYDYDARRYRLIGDLTTNKDFRVPGVDEYGNPGYIASERYWAGAGYEVERTDPYEEKGYEVDQTIAGLLKLYKSTGFKEGSNKALVDLINSNSVTLKLKGSSNFGPIAIPVETGHIILSVTVWDPEMIIQDVFLYRGAITYDDTFCFLTKMQNPSSIPYTVEYFNLDLYNKTDKSGDPVTDADKVGWGFNSRIIARSNDPDNSSETLAEVFLDGQTAFPFGENLYNWRNVIFAFNMTKPDNPSYQGNILWLINSLMDKGVIEGITMKGDAVLWLGQRGNKGFKVEMNTEENFLTLTNVKFYQKYINKYGNLGYDWTGKQPITMLGNFTVGQLQVNKMIVDTNPLAPKMTLDIDANMRIGNPYRFTYDVNDFQALYEAAINNDPFAWSQTNTTQTIQAAKRELVNGSYTDRIVERVVNVPINLTTTYNTNDANEGIFKIFQALGADTRLLNLTNPFYLSPGSAEYYHNPLTTMEFLVQSPTLPQGYPLTILNETKLLVKVMDYQPLRGQHFGDTPRPEDEIAVQDSTATDMPYLGDPSEGSSTTFGYLDDGFHIYNPFPYSVVTNWDQYYNDVLSGTEGWLRRPNQFDYFSMDSPTVMSDSYFPDDEDLSNSFDNVVGGFLAAPGGGYSAGNANDRTGAFDSTINTPHSDLIWRVYQYQSAGWNAGTRGTEMWGPAYDYTISPGNNGDKGYLISMSVPSGERVMFVQNFTIDEGLFLNGASDIEEVTLNIAYRYVEKPGGYIGGDSAYLMFDFFNVWEGNEYNHSSTMGKVPAYNARTGWALPNPGSTEWAHKTVDLTTLFQNRVTGINQAITAGQLAKAAGLRKAEVGFAAYGNLDTLRIQFDDVVLNIKYKDYSKTMTLNLQELFDYLAKEDSVNGDMYNVFSALADNSFIDAMDWWMFLGNDGGPTVPTQDGVDIFKYLQFENVSLSTISKILDEQYIALGVPEPVNFLDVLRNTKYRIKDPNNPYETAFSTPYGPRVLNDQYWAIEDPYYLSRVICDTLYQNIFRTASGSITSADLAEEELWFMLENLGVTPPWIIMYLLTHGWTKNDIFDVLEALGFGQETKADFGDWRDQGRLRAQVNVRARIFGITVINDEGVWMSFDMDPVMQDGTQEVLSSLCASGTGNWDRLIVNNAGSFSSAPPSSWTGTIAGFIPYEITVTPVGFELQIAINPDSWQRIQYPETIDNDAYLILGAGQQSGLNDAGTKQLAGNLRMNYMFNDATFMTMAGDPVSLFQFLDTYYFGEVQGCDYTSFTLLDYFDISALDFMDIITGFSPVTGDFDHNGNGLADDWKCPDGAVRTPYTGTKQYATDVEKAYYEGWGRNFIENRLYWGPDYPTSGQIDGHIIWSDSPDFADPTYAGHADGDIEPGAAPGGDNIAGGAPPIVDLLDMLAWISDTSGSPNPKELMQWLLGELPSNRYLLVNPLGNNELWPTGMYNEGLDNQKTWNMFREGSFNATGFFNWLENEKGISSFKFMYLLEQSTPQVINPTDLLYFSTTPSMVQFIDGALAFFYHNALDSQSASNANNILWTFFASDSFKVDGFYQLLNDSNFHIFDMFRALQVDPASWINNLKAKGIEPITLIKYMLKLDPLEPKYLTLTAGSTAAFNIKANLTFSYDVEGNTITLKRLYGRQIATNLPLSADYHFENFIDSSRLTGPNFVIY